MNPVVAYVDDDLKNLEYYKKSLESSFDVRTFLNSYEFLDSLKNQKYDSYVFDIHMPCMDGFRLFDALRAHPAYKKAPVFYVTSHPQDSDRINSFKIGGVDYFDRMLSDEELVARIQSRIALSEVNSPRAILGNVSIDYLSLDCKVNNQSVSLTLIELKILSTLIRVFPNTLPKDTLIKEVWGSAVMHQNNLNTHFYNLRLKLTDWEYEVKSHKNYGISLSLKA